MKTAIITVAGILALATTIHATEFHVATNGKDSSTGTQDAPLRTIQRAADLAQPGDVITVHEGVYRERISPPRGGQSDAKRIVYQAAPGEKVEIKGSEIVRNWVKVQDDTWKATLPNSFFGGFNPYRDLIRGDWFNPKGREHHTGAVYLNGEWLAEAAKLDEVLKPVGTTPLWFGRVDEGNTAIWAQFKGVDPNEQLVEINVRQTIFYPDKPGKNYITVRGFIMRHAATPWAPPTAEQIGLIGTHWSKGWIIENNVISHSICSGIALGKYGDEWDNTSANTAEGYVKTIERAQQTGFDKLSTDRQNEVVQATAACLQRNGWNKETIGHHVVRHNTISHCEQAGIVGSLGAIFSVVSGNVIHDIHVRKLFSGAEMAGIKFHAAIDTEISRNHIYRTCRGLWLDWMTQGTRVSANLFHDNQGEDLFVEVNHGPFLVDNNIFLSPMTLRDMSQGGAYAHNLIAGNVKLQPDLKRLTPFHKPHSTDIAGFRTIIGGDDRFYNNLFVGFNGLAEYDAARLPMWMDGNVFLNGANPSKHETNPLVKPEFDPALKLVETADGFHLELTPCTISTAGHPRKLVTTELLGKAAIPDLPYEQPDGAPVRVNTDYFGKRRGDSDPMPGPFENVGEGTLRVKVW
ncbi:MAG TPA: right-handed parallel beta-helix repeat-containing protein [Phycisphaerae bacterium]|nr:right-handed parallel beta-helix repeat-containing protein [Phycisphaerae bacterium]